MFTASLLIAASLSFGSMHHRPIGDSTFVAQVPPSPGFPEGVVIVGRRAYVTGPAAFEAAGFPPSEVNVFNIDTGQLLDTYIIEGEEINEEHGLSGIAADLFGRIYVLSTQLGVIRINPTTGRQKLYASAFPDLFPCGPGVPEPCSPAAFYAPPLPNDIAFDWLGNAYVTDTLQGTIFKIPAGGGAPQVWFQDARFVTDFGPNGIRLGPDGMTLYVAVSGIEMPSTIYTLPATASPSAIDLDVFHVYPPFTTADGLAFAQSGNLYVTLALSNELSVLDPAGNEVATYAGPMQSPDGFIPWANPAVLAFDSLKRRVIVVNHAIFMPDPNFFALFDVYVGERGAFPVTPIILP